MRGDESLNAAKIQHAVISMSYTGFEATATGFLLVMQALGKTPKQMMEILE